jgi:hypothetical protein
VLLTAAPSVPRISPPVMSEAPGARTGTIENKQSRDVVFGRGAELQVSGWGEALNLLGPTSVFSFVFFFVLENGSCSCMAHMRAGPIKTGLPPGAYARRFN